MMIDRGALRAALTVWMGVCAVLLGSATQAELSAQSVVRGILFDSLRFSGIVGASVHVLGAERLRAITGDSGEFILTGVEVGRHTLRFEHPRIDSLGLETIDVPFEVDSASHEVRVFASTPGLGRVLTLLCGPTEPGRMSLAVHVRDAQGGPVDAAHVRVDWIEEELARRKRTRSERTSDGVTSAQGAAVLCALPPPGSVEPRGGSLVTTSSFRISVTRDGLSGGPFVVERGEAGVQLLPIVVGDDAARASVAGRVLSSSDSPLPGARIRVEGADLSGTTADSSGAFRLVDLPVRTQQAHVSAIGFSPRRVLFTPGDVSADELERIQLDSILTQLDTVRVIGRREMGAEARFEDRRRMLSGTFLDSADFRRMPRLSSGVLAQRVPRAFIVNSIDGRRTFAFRRPGLAGIEVYCVPRLFLDGQDQGRLEIGQLDQYVQLATRIEVYRANYAPPEFTDFDGCGAVVIWTR